MAPWGEQRGQREDAMASRRARRKEIAKAALRNAHRSDRPIEAATANDRDPTRRSARQLLELTRGVDPKEVKEILAGLASEREAHGHDNDDPHKDGALMARQIDEIARHVDDRVEAVRARDNERDPDGYDDDSYEDDEADFDDWLHDAYGVTADQLDATLEQLDQKHQQALLDGLDDLYDLHLEGHDPETALRMLQEHHGGHESESAGGDPE